MPSMVLHSMFWDGIPGPGPPAGGGHAEFNGIDSHANWLRRLHILLPLLYFIN